MNEIDPDKVPSVATSIALINQKLGVMEESVKNNEGLARDNNEKLIRLNGMREELKNHTTSDKWMFSILITLLIGVLIKGFV